MRWGPPCRTRRTAPCPAVSDRAEGHCPDVLVGPLRTQRHSCDPDPGPGRPAETGCQQLEAGLDRA